MSRVYFVGAGPGDPELITVAGQKLLRQADCVIYDRLVAPELLRMTRKKCECLYVGKESDEGGRSQMAINRLLVKKAREHSAVVRLKGGDPTLFGRITEEMNALRQAGVSFQVVPGVSSAWAAAAAAGIPLTDRRYSSSVAIVTGQEAAGKRSSVRWDLLARGADTLVILMGRRALPEIARKLRKAGRPGATPVAVIRWASTPKQEVLISSLATVERDLEDHPSFDPPVVTVVGKVAGFSQWPLTGKRILITRPKEDQESLGQRLKGLGASCVFLPTVKIAPRKLSTVYTKGLLERIPKFDWVIFTSHHGVETLARLTKRFGKKLPQLLWGKVCAIGPRTASAVAQAGLKTDLVPQQFSTEGVKRAFEKLPVAGRKVLIPRSNLGARDALAAALKKRGAHVEEAILYETKPTAIGADQIRRALKGLDAATFTSASTVKGFFDAISKARLSRRQAFNGAAVVAIGPATARELKRRGIRPHLPKGSWTVQGLTEAVVEALRT